MTLSQAPPLDSRGGGGERDHRSVELGTIGIVARRSQDRATPAIQKIRDFAAASNVELRYEGETLALAPAGSRALDLESEGVDLIVALGGDGTLLRASRVAAGRGIPVLGVNLGYLGFLTAAGEDSLEAALQQIADGEFMIDRRFTLRASILSEEGEVKERTFLAINDFVIHKGGAARVTRLDLSVAVDGHEDEIGSFSADGVIIATPTGSTAYSMSAGGPIVVPSVECIAITAICPHTLAVRPLVIPTGARIRVRAVDRLEDLVLTVDGQQAEALDPGDAILVERGDVEIELIRFPGQTFFSTMRRKLNWAIRSGEGQ